MANETNGTSHFKFELTKAFESEARKLFAYAKKDEIACGLIRATNMDSSYLNWLASYLTEKIHGDVKQLNKRMEQKQDLEFIKLVKLGVPEAEARKRAYVSTAQAATTQQDAPAPAGKQ